MGDYPNPTMITGEPGIWYCPVCGDCTVRWGVERRRWGWRPWPRRVHVDDATPPWRWSWRRG
jgi:hypothetical protein